MASAQDLNKVVFGPLVGDEAGTITVTNGMPNLVVDCWVRSDPGIPAPIYGVAHGLMSEDLVIAARNDFFWDEYYDMPNWGQTFQDRYVHDPDDNFPIPEGHTAEVTTGIYHFPAPEGDPLDTQGEWDYYGYFLMDVNVGLEEEAEYCPFSEGWMPHSGMGTDWAFQNPPGGSVTPEQSYACLWVTANTDPEFTLCPADACADAGIAVCLDIAGSDVDVLDDLHIALVPPSPGYYTEETGGEGGSTTGTWCWDDPTEGEHVVTLELTDGSGGFAICEFTVVVSPIIFEIDCKSGLPGVPVEVPVRLHTCAFETGGISFLARWDPYALELTDVEPASRIDFGNEFFHWSVGNAGSTVRVTWISDINNGVPHPPASPGSDPVFTLHFLINPSLPFGMFVPVEFWDEEDSDNSISDPSGYVWLTPVQDDGCVEIMDAESYKGDPNMNGTPYEIGDVVLVGRRLIHGWEVWAENGTTDDDEMQEGAADLNLNGFADIGDYIMFILILQDEIDPPKVEPSDAIAQISMPDVIGDNMEVTVEAGIDVGGVLVSIDHSGVELGVPLANSGMELLYHDADGVMNVVVYSMDANVLPAGSSTLFTIPVLSNSGGSMSFAEVSSADSYGRLMETVASLVAPLPTAYTVEQNYPNPFNARTQIGVALPEASDVNVDIYSITGQLVETISGYYEAGNHSITWNASDVSSGIYFYKVTAGDFSQTMKMTLLK